MFYVHVDASAIAVGAVLAHPGEGNIDHPISSARFKLSYVERNYTTIDHEGLSMVYALQKFRHHVFIGKYIQILHGSLSVEIPGEQTFVGGEDLSPVTSVLGVQFLYCGKAWQTQRGTRPFL